MRIISILQKKGSIMQKELCDYCVKSDVCPYIEKRRRLEEEYYPFQMRCSLYLRRTVNAKDVRIPAVLSVQKEVNDGKMARNR